MDEPKDTINLTVVDFPFICRVCLNKTDLRPFEELGLLDLFDNLTGIKIEPEDNLPKNVCGRCIHQLENIFSFICLSKSNDAKLQQILNNSIKSSDSDVDDSSEFLDDPFDDSVDIKSECDENPDTVDNVKDEISLASNECKKKIKKPQRHSTKRQASKCEICGEAFATKSKLNEHQKKNSGCRTRHYKCSHCEKAFFTKFRLKLHMRSHTKETPFECKICSKKFRHSPNLKRHDDIVHKGLRPYKCEVCGKVFSRLDIKNAHVHIHKGKNLKLEHFDCHTCGKSFRSYTTLFMHKRLHKINKEEKPKTEEPRNHLKCVICDKAFSSKAGVYNHMRIHLNEKEYLCVFCGKEFLRKVQLESHSRIHTGEKPYECQLCGKQFRHITGYKMHILVHTGEKPYQCEECGRAFSQQSHLRTHTKTHTGEKPYTCEFCGKAFAVRGNLTVHTRIHTGDKPYSCPVCSLGFYDSSSMKKHKRAHDPLSD